MTAPATKSELRRQLKQRRTEFDGATLHRSSAFIQRFTLDLPHLTTATSVCGFLPLAHEVQIGTLLDLLVTAGKVVLVPVFDHTIDAYRWARYDRSQPWRDGKFGIPEPVAPVWDEPADDSVILVPGLAFDCHGHRLGHGLGFYDRLLAGFGGKKVGLAYSYQLVDSVPQEEHDVPVDVLITEDGVHTCGSPDNDTSPFGGAFEPT